MFSKGTDADKERYEKHEQLIKSLARLENVTWMTSHDQPPESATAIVGDLEILIPMAGLINKAEESARLNREIAKLKKDTERAESKLHNPSFVDKAPADVVIKEREKLHELKSLLMKMEQQLEKIAML